jgi:hypothetical protein
MGRYVPRASMFMKLMFLLVLFISMQGCALVGTGDKKPVKDLHLTRIDIPKECNCASIGYLKLEISEEEIQSIRNFIKFNFDAKVDNAEKYEACRAPILPVACPLKISCATPFFEQCGFAVSFDNKVIFLERTDDGFEEHSKMIMGSGNCF